eukprot:gene7446-9151_t
MNQLEISLIGVGGGVFFILIVILIVYFIYTRDRKTYEPLEKGNVFVYQRDTTEQTKEDQILMNARFYLRSTMYSLDRKLVGFGSRVDKQYFSVMGNSVNKNDNIERIMSMTPVSKQWPIPLQTELGRTTYCTIIKSLEIHPFISVPIKVDFIPEKSTSVSIRPFYQRGSLRDFIHQSKPKMPYSDKYNTHFQLNPKLISKFGRQILEGLIFLKNHNFPHFHLNASNILMDDNICLIADYENAFLGLKPRYFKLLAGYPNMDPEIISFACILFEMSCGYEIDTPEAIELGVPAHCNPEIKKIIESIFKPWYGTPPTLEELTKLDFFSEHKFKNLPIQRVTFTSKERDMIDAVIKLNRSFITSQKAEDLPSLKKLKKQKKRKSLAHAQPFQEPISLTPTNTGTNYNTTTTLSSTYSLPPSLSSSYNPSTSSLSSSFSTSTITFSPVSAPPPPNTPTSTVNMSQSFTPMTTSPPPPPPPPLSQTYTPTSSSASSATSGGPPPPPPPPPPSGGGGRKNLLSSIENFSSASLKKTKTVDKSGPKLK